MKSSKFLILISLFFCASVFADDKNNYAAGVKLNNFEMTWKSNNLERVVTKHNGGTMQPTFAISRNKWSAEFETDRSKMEFDHWSTTVNGIDYNFYPQYRMIYRGITIGYDYNEWIMFRLGTRNYHLNWEGRLDSGDKVAFADSKLTGIAMGLNTRYVLGGGWNAIFNFILQNCESSSAQSTYFQSAVNQLSGYDLEAGFSYRKNGSNMYYQVGYRKKRFNLTLESELTDTLSYSGGSATITYLF